VLADLGVDSHAPGRVIEVWNKIDLVAAGRRPPPTIAARVNGNGAAPEAVAVSALTGEGLPALLAAIERRVVGERQTYEVVLTGADLAGLHRLYALGEVLTRADQADGSTRARVRVSGDREDAFRRSFPAATKATG
jgi:GTP-binding protein HflX